MERSYFLIALLGCSLPMVAMEMKDGKNEAELTEIKVVQPTLSAHEFMAQLRIKESFDVVLASLTEMSKNAPARYSKLVAQTNDPQAVLLELAKYENTKKDSRITHLTTAVISWRNLAVYGWFTAAISLTAFSAAALVMAANS